MNGKENTFKKIILTQKYMINQYMSDVLYIPYHHISSQVCMCKELWSLMVSIALDKFYYISVESPGFLVVLEHLKM